MLALLEVSAPVRENMVLLLDDDIAALTFTDMECTHRYTLERFLKISIHTPSFFDLA